MTLSLEAALFAGLFSFLSPCVLPLVPTYLLYLGGERGRPMFNAVFFVLGFSLVFLLLGLPFTILGSLLLENRRILGQVGGVAMVLFGLYLLGLRPAFFVHLTHRLNLRYQGQAYDLEVAVPRGSLDDASVCGHFHAEHERLYGFREPKVPVQTATVRLGVIGKVPAVALPEAQRSEPRPIGRRAVWHGGKALDAAVYARADIGAAAVIRGPAIVEQLDTTTFVLPGWRAEADHLGALHLMREGAA